MPIQGPEPLKARFVSKPTKGPVVALRTCPLSTRAIIDRVVLFTEAIGDVKFYTYQSLFVRRIVESVLLKDGSVITALLARQSGKSTSVACVCLGLAVILPALAQQFPDDDRLKHYLKGFCIGIYAPKLEQAEDTFGKIRDRAINPLAQEIMGDPEIGVHIVRDRSETYVFSNGSYILARTASEDSNIEGKTYHLIIVEEAQRVSRTKIEKDLSPMLSSTNGLMVKIGTAWESRGGFHKSIQHNVDAHTDGGPRNHFEFPFDIIAAEKRRMFEKDGNPAHLNYEKYVNAEITRLGGRNTPEFKMNYLCLWQESRVIAVSDATMAAAADKRMESSRRLFPLQVAGLDVGKVNDPTVCTLMGVDLTSPVINRFTLPGAEDEKQTYFHKVVIDWLELDGSFEGQAGQYRRLVEFLQDTHVTVLVVDSTGMGDPVFERLDAMIGGTVTCVPYRFSPMSKSLLFKYYLQELHAGRVHYAAGELTSARTEYAKFVREHLDLDRQDHGGYVSCAAPEGGHDDYPVSAALAAWGEKVAAEVAMPVIRVQSAGGLGAAGRYRSGGMPAGAYAGGGNAPMGGGGEAESSDGSPFGRANRYRKR